MKPTDTNTQQVLSAMKPCKTSILIGTLNNLTESNEQQNHSFDQFDNNSVTNVSLQMYTCMHEKTASKILSHYADRQDESFSVVSLDVRGVHTDEALNWTWQ